MTTAPSPTSAEGPTCWLVHAGNNAAHLEEVVLGHLAAGRAPHLVGVAA